MDNTTPTGYTVVDSPLPYAILDTYVDENYLTEEIDSLWASRQSYGRAIQSQKNEMRGFETTLGEMLYTMKAVLSKPGRGGGWSSWLKERSIPIPRASADRMVQRFAATLPRGLDKLPHDAIQDEPSEAQIGTLFAAVWPRLERKLATANSRFQFLRCLIYRSGLGYDWQGDGIKIFEPGSEPQEPEVVGSTQEIMTGEEDDGAVL